MEKSKIKGRLHSIAWGSWQLQSPALLNATGINTVRDTAGTFKPLIVRTRLIYAWCLSSDFAISSKGANERCDWAPFSYMGGNFWETTQGSCGWLNLCQRKRRLCRNDQLIHGLWEKRRREREKLPRLSRSPGEGSHVICIWLSCDSPTVSNAQRLLSTMQHR